MSAIMSMPLTSQGAAAPAPMVAGADTVPGLTPAGQPLAQQMGFSLSRNPMLPQHPLGAYTDSLYEASVAQLRQQIMQQYNDVLQQLGYADENGNFVPGTLEIDANRQRSDLARSQQLAAEGVTQDAQRMGTLFSGPRGTLQARAEHPFVSAQSDLDVQVPRSLSQLYEQAGGLVNEYTTQNNLLLADAAQRAAQNFMSQPGGNAAAAAATGLTGGAGGAGGGFPVQPNMIGTNSQITSPGTVAPTSDYAFFPTRVTLPSGGTTTVGGIQPAPRAVRPAVAV